MDRPHGRHQPQPQRQPPPLGLLQRPGNLLRQHPGNREQTMKISNFKSKIFSVSLCLCGCLLSSSADAKDHTMFGGTPQRNMVSDDKNPPTQWDVAKNENIK